MVGEQAADAQLLSGGVERRRMHLAEELETLRVDGVVSESGHFRLFVAVIGRGRRALEVRGASADTAHVGRRLLARLRRADGFGLVELLIAMMILNIGLIALMGAFISGVKVVRQASRTSTASTLADTQLELYRALTYSAIALDPLSVPTTAPYTTDAAYVSTQVTLTCALGTYTSYPQCNASRTLTGPDHGRYRVDTYIVSRTPTAGRAIKAVTVVVRDSSNLSGPALARVSTSFDQSTGS